jgi:hypothetical protein
MTKTRNEGAGVTVKAAGLKSLEQMAAISGRNVSTLKDWHKNDRQVFDVLLVGCAALAGSPFGVWLKPSVLIATGHQGPVVYKTDRGRLKVGFVESGAVWTDEADRLPESGVVSVMAFKREG